MSVMETDALRAPVAVGVNFTVIAQVAFAATLTPQVLDREKSPGFVPVRPMVVMLRVSFQVFVSVTLCAALVVPVLWEPKGRMLAERFTAGARGGGVPPPPPPPLPPHAAHTPAKRRVVANNTATGRRRNPGEHRSIARATKPAHNHRKPIGMRKFGGRSRCRMGGEAQLPAVVVMVNVLVAAEVPVTVTDEGEIVHVPPGGQPFITLRSTIPVNPPCGVMLIVEFPVCPGAEIVRGEGFADSLKSATAIGTAAEVEPAYMSSPGYCAVMVKLPDGRLANTPSWRVA